MQMVVVVVEVYCTTASARTAGDGGGGGEQTGPGVEGARELHAAGVVAWKGAISPSSSFPYALDGLCKGHISSRLNHTQETLKYICKYTTMCIRQ